MKNFNTIFEICQRVKDNLQAIKDWFDFYYVETQSVDTYFINFVTENAKQKKFFIPLPLKQEKDLTDKLSQEEKQNIINFLTAEIVKQSFLSLQEERGLLPFYVTENRDLKKALDKLVRILDRQKEEPGNTYHDWEAEILQAARNIGTLYKEIKGGDKKNE